MVHRIHIEKKQSGLSRYPSADNVLSSTKGRRNAEAVPRTIEHFQDLLSPLSTPAVELYASRLEDVEVLTIVSLREDELTRLQGLRLAAGGNGFEDLQI